MKFKVLIASVLVFLVVGSVYVFFSGDSLEEALTHKKWCIFSFKVDGYPVMTYTEGVEGFSYNLCKESATFYEDGTVLLPGISTPAIKASWELEGDSLSVSGADTLGHIFNGVYSVTPKDGALILASKKTYMFLMK